MALNTQGIAIVGGEHVVHFYDGDSQLLDMVVPYLLGGAWSGEIALVIATDAHHRAFEAELEAAGIDLVHARAEGRYVALDAAELMAGLMPAGQVDRHAFDRVVGRLLRQTVRSGRAIRVYGEVVGLLWDAGDVVGAIALEGLWNELALELPFSIVCAYRAASVPDAERADALQQVCGMHSSVLCGERAAGLRRAERFSSQELAAVFPAGRSSPGEARRLLASAQRQWGHPGLLVEYATLICSELATNAVVHARSPFSLTVRLLGGVLRLTVEDARPEGAPGVGRPLAPTAGHGLAVIESLATCWGVERTPNGKAVWAELPI
jgi:anti-sigma regulatory factor (Ser/Thr protein kinase)